MKIAEYQSTADQCRAMGLKISDTIQGRETYQDHWEDARLTLLFIGKESAVFHEQTRNNLNPEWEDHGESADWTLDCREWVKVESAPAPAGDAAMPVARVESADNQDGFVFTEIEGRMKFLRIGDLIYSAPPAPAGDAAMPAKTRIQIDGDTDAASGLALRKFEILDSGAWCKVVLLPDALAALAALEADIARLTAERDNQVENYNKLQAAFNKADAGWMCETDHLDDVIRMLGLKPDDYRRAGGCFVFGKLRAELALLMSAVEKRDNLAAQVEALRKDAERLDLLIEKELVVFEGPRKTFQIRDAREDRAIGGIFDDARAAIDAFVDDAK